MNLADFQAQWLDLLMAVQENPPGQAFVFDAQTTIFGDISEAKITAIAQMVEQGKVSVLCGALPKNLTSLLPSVMQTALAQRYTRAFPQSTVIPASQGVKDWLLWLIGQKEVQQIPFAQAILAYELAVLRLCFHQLPRMPVLRHKKLAPWASLCVSTPYLNDILNAIKQDQPLPEANVLEANRRQGWLLYRCPNNEIKHISIHWGVYEILELLEGEHSWVYYLEQVCKRYPDLLPQQEMLGQWLTWLEEKNLLSYY